MRWSFYPILLREFLYRWDFFIVPLVAVAAAVLCARWLEAKMSYRRFSVAITTSCLLAAVALFPATVRFEAKPVMASPVLIAIQDDYPLETVAAILDRYPHLANAAVDDWGQTEPLVTAAYERKTNFVELLIRKGANVDVAVERLMQVDWQEALSLVLMCAESHNKSVHTNSAPPSR
jgi:hypothetical protein